MVRTKGSVKAKRERTEREKLELFIRKVDDLNSTRLAKMSFSAQYRIQYRPEQLVESNLEQPDESDFMAYLSIFRHFISISEDVILNRIFNICLRRLTNDEMKQNLAHARQSFERVTQHNGLYFQENGKQLTPLQVTDMYLNGKYFHNDLEYKQQLDSMSQFEANFKRFYFLNFVINTSRIIDYMRNGLDHALREGLFLFDAE